jgi:adenine C2-methylase RlmN of 23S rRNA A2503 and tRNA A37
MTVIFNDEELANYAKVKKIQPFRVKQILYELYKNQNISRSDMTTLPKDLKEDLSKHFEILNLVNEEIIETHDTTKFAFKTTD